MKPDQDYIISVSLNPKTTMNGLILQSKTHLLACCCVTESYVFAIGADIVDDDLLPLTVGPEGETQYFRLKKETDLAATFDDVIGKFLKKKDEKLQMKSMTFFFNFSAK